MVGLGSSPVGVYDVRGAVCSGSMAVAARDEYGLFVDGETSEPAAAELRELIEPATGEPLAKAAMAGEADVDRAPRSSPGTTPC
jgi:hypothetical protein